MTITIIPWIVVLIFGGIFVFAGIREVMRHWAHGPPENPRDAFEFDESAPSYEEPEEPETLDADDQQTPHDDGAEGADVDPINRSGSDTGSATQDDTRPKAGSADQIPTDKPDKNEAPK